MGCSSLSVESESESDMERKGGKSNRGIQMGSIIQRIETNNEKHKLDIR